MWRLGSLYVEITLPPQVQFTLPAEGTIAAALHGLLNPATRSAWLLNPLVFVREGPTQTLMLAGCPGLGVG